MSERKRGEPFPNPMGRSEAQRLAPYPTWKAWKHNVFEFLKKEGFYLGDGQEEVVEEWYQMRRVYQQGKLTSTQLTKQVTEFTKAHPEHFDHEGFMEALRFITERTQRLPQNGKFSKKR